jgi:hypothetical protein
MADNENLREKIPIFSFLCTIDNDELHGSICSDPEVTLNGQKQKKISLKRTQYSSKPSKTPIPAAGKVLANLCEFGFNHS